MISVTLLSSYMYCARKLFLEKVLGIKSEIPKEALVKGSIRHQIYEKINCAEEKLAKSIGDKEPGAILDKYKYTYLGILKETIMKNRGNLKSIGIPLTDFFSQLKPLIIAEAEYRANRIAKFISETGFLGDELWENITPKVKPEYRISSETLGLRGIIDELEVYDSSLVPIELKTGKAPAEGVWPGHKIQAGAYALLIEDSFGTPVRSAVVRYLDTNVSREITINPFLRQEIKELIDKVNKLLKSGKIPDFPSNENKCNACDLKDICFNKPELEEKIMVKTKDLNRT